MFQCAKDRGKEHPAITRFQDCLGDDWGIKTPGPPTCSSSHSGNFNPCLSFFSIPLSIVRSLTRLFSSRKRRSREHCTPGQSLQTLHALAGFRLSRFVLETQVHCLSQLGFSEELLCLRDIGTRDDA